MGIETLAAVALAVGAAATTATTAYTLSKGSPKLPDVPPPAAPPPAPPPPAAPPPEVTAADTDPAVSADRRKRQRRYGVADTQLVSPLGGSSTTAPTSRSLLGGG